MAGACESRYQATAVHIGALATTGRGRGFVVLSCCVIEPTASAPARPLRPAAGARGHGPVHPTTGRSAAALSPCPAPLQLRASDTCGGPGPGVQRAPTQLRLRHHDRVGEHRHPRPACPGRPGMNARLIQWWGAGQPRPGPLLKAGRAAGAIELNLFSVPIAWLHSRVSRLAPIFRVMVSFNFLRSSL